MEVNRCGVICVLLGAGLAASPHILEKQLGSVFGEVLECVGKGQMCVLAIRSRVVPSFE